MITLLDTGQDLEQCAAEICGPVGQLLTPLTRYKLQNTDLPFAIDNGAFSRFDEAAFFALLAREEHRKNACKFVSAPDVVGSARRTLEVFSRWKNKLQGWKIALVAQDGQEDLEIPWDEISAVFIGGTNKFKLSEDAIHIIKAAKLLGKWVHVGRVNDPARFEHFEQAGADSIDGTGLARYSHMRLAISKRNNQKRLFENA